MVSESTLRRVERFEQGIKLLKEIAEACFLGTLLFLFFRKEKLKVD